MSTVKMVDASAKSSNDPSCSSCAKMKEALEASKKEHSLTLRMVKEKIISTDELIKKYQQKCHESDKHHQQATDTTLKLETAQVKIESLQGQLDRSLHSSEPLRKNVARLHREKSLADSAISDLREKLQNFEKTNAELLSTAKIKEEQECAWRLEKQLQAHEMQKQKKSLQKSEATIAKLQEQLKKEKEQNKELNRLLSQAKKTTTKLEKELEKSKEEIQSVKLDAEFAKALGVDLNETPKRRQRQKAPKTPQVPKELKQTSPSSPRLNQPLAHIFEELTVLSDIGPALSPLPPSPDRGTLESSSGSEDGSGSESGSEDDGNASDNGDSDYSLGDLADILVGDHNDDEMLEACPLKTRSKAKDVENNFEEETKAISDADIENTESGSSLGQALNEDDSIAHCDEDNSKEDTPNLLTTIQKNDIQTRMNEDSATTNSEPCNTEKKGDESSKTVKLSKVEKHKALMPSPQRNGKRRVTSPKPRVMTRSRAKAMKLSTSSDGDGSSEKGTGNENLTQEHEMSGACLKCDSKAGKVENLKAGCSGNDENETTDAKKAFTEGLKGIEPKVHVEEKSQSLFSNTPSSGNVDVSHHHGNVPEPVSSVASLSGSEGQVCNEDDSNVLSAEVEANVIQHHRNDGELGVSTASLSLVANEDNSSENSTEVVEDATHHHSNDVELDDSKTIANEDDSHVSSVFEVKATTNLSTKLETDSEQEFSVTNESGSGFKDDASLIMYKEENDVIPSHQDSQEKSESTLTNNATNDLTNTEKSGTSQGSQNTTSVGSDTLTSQLHVGTKEDIFEQRDKPLEENNNNVLEELEAVREKLEVDSVDLIDNKDSCDQTEPIVQKISEHSSCTIERKGSDLSETSTTCVGGKNENRRINVTDSSFEVESNSYFLCEVSGKETSAFIDSSQDETTGISSSTVEVGFNPLTMNYKKGTTTKTTALAEATATTETTELFSTGSHKDETSQDSNLITKGDNLLNDEAVQYGSVDELEVECSEGGHDSSAQEEISILTAEPSRKCSDLEGDVSSSRNVIQEGSSTSSEVKESSNLEREMPFCRILINEEEQFSTGNEERKQSDCTKVVPPSKTIALEARGPSTYNEGGFGHRGDMSSSISKEGSLTLNDEEKHSDRGKDAIASGAVSKPSTFNIGTMPSGSKQDKSYHDGKTVIQETRKSARPASSLLDAEKIGLEGSETILTLSLSSNEAAPPEDPSAVHDAQGDSPMKDLFNNLECLLDDFPALSPLPPSPCPSDDEVCPASPISSTDLTTEKPHCATNLTSTKTSFETPGTFQMKRNQTIIFTEVASKRVQRTSLGNNTACFTTKANRKDTSVKNFDVKGKTRVSESTPCTRGSVSIKRSLQQPSSTPHASENLTLKRSFQQSVSESAKDQSVASQSKKMKTNPKVTQKQGTSNLEKSLNTPKATGKADPSKQPSKGDGANNGPMLFDYNEPIPPTNDGPVEEDNDGPTLKEALKTASNSTKAAGNKQSKCNGISPRPSHMPEVKYVLRCLSRVYEDNVKLHSLVDRLTTKRCISSSTPVASAIVQFLKEREDDLMPHISIQLEQFQCNDSLKSWKPVHSGFESRLLEVVTLLTSNALFGNLIPQLVTLVSRSLMTDCCSLNGAEVKKGDLSLCRVLTALCLLKDELGCARTVCYDIIRCLCAFQNTALELIVAMVTVWPEVLKTSSYCLSDEQCPLVHTLKLVLLSWAQKPQSADLGNILRVLCCWGDDSVTEEVLKDLGLQLIKLLHEERAASVRIGTADGRLVLDRHSFEIVKSLELLSCVLGWQWTLNELIINNIWQTLKSWADKKANDEPTNDISGGETCCFNDYNVSREKSNVAVSTNQEANDGKSLSSAEEKEEGDAKVLDVCSKCGKLTRIRLPESQTVLCVQLLGILCRIAIENGQSLVPEITDLLCGLIEDTSTDSKSKVTYAIQLATATSLLDLSPWQPDRVASVLGKWIAALKESGSLQAPAYVAQGLVCLKSILRTNQT